MVHGYLPCPDTNNDGQEDRTPQGCTGNPSSRAKEKQLWIGILPWFNLGVGERDSWNNRFTYAVSKPFTESSRFPHPVFSLQTEGTIQVVNGVNNTPAVVLSHGANTRGGLSVHGIIQAMPTSTAEQENSNGDGRFEYAPYNNDTVQGFDDQMVWISAPILKNRLLMAGRIKH